MSGTALKKTKTTSSVGSALSKLLVEHKLLVSDQVLCLQLKCTLLWSCWLFRVCSLPDLNLKQQFQVVKSVLLHFILEIRIKTLSKNRKAHLINLEPSNAENLEACTFIT